jgi:hypothetical protein
MQAGMTSGNSGLAQQPLEFAAAHSSLRARLQ